jgi:hypothetical protein
VWFAMRGFGGARAVALLQRLTLIRGVGLFTNFGGWHSPKLRGIVQRRWLATTSNDVQNHAMDGEPKMN